MLLFLWYIPSFVHLFSPSCEAYSVLSEIHRRFYFHELMTLDFLLLSSIYVRYQTNSPCIYRNSGSAMMLHCSVSDVCVIAHPLVVAAHWLLRTVQSEVCVNIMLQSTPTSPYGLSSSRLPPKIVSLFPNSPRVWHEEEMHFNCCHSYGNARKINTIDRRCCHTKHCSLRLYGNIISQAAEILFIPRSVELVRVADSYCTYALILLHSGTTWTGKAKFRKDITYVLILSETLLWANNYKHGWGINVWNSSGNVSLNCVIISL
jgi:hypothetical protein